MKNKTHTPYDDVNAILDILLMEMEEILKEQFVGMYLFGSLANGDFDNYSDVDVLIVTKDEIPESVFSALHVMHERISSLDSAWATQLEVSYIPQNALRRFDPANMRHPHLDRGNGEKLHMMTHANDWIIQRHILREHGINITGPDLQTLIDPVLPNDLRQAVADVLPIWVNPILEDSSQINRRGYQSFFVLSLCRMLYTLKHGAIVSKPFAAKWAKENLSHQWTALIERAWAGRQNPSLEAQSEDINGTLDLIRYTLQQIKPTLYPDVNEVLNLLLAGVKEILGNQFIGIYLYGSLSSGDFNPKSSDIDFLVVTESILPEETISVLADLHQRIWASGLKWASKLEGSYIPKDLIRRHDPNGPPCPTVNEGKFYLDQRGSDWIIQRHVIRESGVVLEGPDPKTLIDFVAPDDIRQSVLGVLREWWFPMLDNSKWLQEHGSEYHAFAVISMCRALHALEHGTIVSKPKAIQWARKKLDISWTQLIDKSVAASQHKEQNDFLSETLDFIRFTMEYVNKNFI